MGLELAGGIIGLTLAGWWVDHHWGTFPKGIVVGAAIGIVGGGYNFLRQSLQMIHEQERLRKRERDERESSGKGD